MTINGSRLRGWVCFSAIIFAMCVPAVLATTVVGIRANDGFIIATDSKATYRGLGTKGPATVCKIFQSGSLYFTFAGLANDPSRDFFPEKTVASNFSAADSFARNIAKIERAVSDSLKAEMQRLKTEDPDGFASNNRPGADTLSMVAGEMVKGSPYMSARGFRYTDKITAVTISRLNCPGDCLDGVEFFLAGSSDAARRTWFYDRGTARDFVAESRKLVEAQIQASPEQVGPPITILRVNGNGATWISNDAGCPIVATP